MLSSYQAASYAAEGTGPSLSSFRVTDVLCRPVACTLTRCGAASHSVLSACAAADWIESTGPDGRPYYYNKRTAQSVWERPAALAKVRQTRGGSLTRSQLLGARTAARLGAVGYKKQTSSAP